MQKNEEKTAVREIKKPQWLFVAAAVVIILAGLKVAAPLIIPFLLAVFISLLGAPIVLWLQRRRFPMGLAVLIVVLGMVSVILGLGLLVGSSVSQFTAMVPKYQSRFQELLQSFTEWMGGYGITLSEEQLMGSLDPGVVMDLVGGTLMGLAATLSNFVLVVLTVTFILLEVSGFPAKLRAAMGDAEADLSRFARVTIDIKKYLMYKTFVSLLTGLLAGGWTALLGVDFPILWGVTAFLLNYIPNLGSVLAAVPPALLALIMMGPMSALLVTIGYLVINLLLGNLLEPMLMGRKLGLSVLVVFLSLIFWGWLWGPVGMLLSVPLSMVIKISLDNSENYQWVAIMLGPKVSARGHKKSVARFVADPFKKGVPVVEVEGVSSLDSEEREEAEEPDNESDDALTKDDEPIKPDVGGPE